MKIFTRLATLLGRLREREADTNPEAAKAKKKNKGASSSGSSGNKKKRRVTQTVLKSCLKHPEDPNAKPKKRKWSIKFIERVTVYEVQEIVDNPKKKGTTPLASPEDASKVINVQASDKVSKPGNVTSPPTEYKTRLRIYYDPLARPSRKNIKLVSESGLHM